VNPPCLILTPGDPAGIGPEIVWKTLGSGDFQRKGIRILCVGARAPLEEHGARIVAHDSEDSWLSARESAPNEPVIHLLSAPVSTPAPVKRSAAALAGFQSGWSISRAVKIVRALENRGERAALVTGPISKERLQAGGFPFPGHTELLAHLCKADKVRMMLANDLLRITLVTTHIPLSQVPRAVTGARIEATLSQTAEHLTRWWGITRPRIGVAALNPHAGESGLFGKEEIRVIAPAIRRFQRKHAKRCEISGPLPADTLFANNSLADPKDRFDAVVCMYHDQGLIPVKLLDFKRTVNITLGLPIVRTSVDHGVAFDIAGTGQADPSSLRQAMKLAVEILERRIARVP
jgi:4-hydroxythreonine-4-phosphate dehydrogenase